MKHLIEELQILLRIWGVGKQQQATDKQLQSTEREIKVISGQISYIICESAFENFDPTRIYNPLNQEMEYVFNGDQPYIKGSGVRVYLQETDFGGSPDGCYIFVAPDRDDINDARLFFGYIDDHFTLNLTLQALTRPDFTL